jgi:tRNA dimethylallyltransferase
LVPADLTSRASILVVCGPTCSGKGGLARQLAVRFGGEVISADSRKIFRGFDVGTAKPPAGVREQIPHHLVDCCDPDEMFSAARFVDLADGAIRTIGERGGLPILAGGTGLYIRALLHGIVDTPSRDEDLRARLLDEEADHPGTLHQRLLGVDPVSAEQIPPADLVRIVRALEVLELTGRPISEIQARHGFGARRYRALQLAPAWEREDLYSRIDQRVDRMMEAGWLDEVKRLLGRGLGQSPAFKTVGYRQLKEHLEGGLGLEQAVADIKREHRRYSRRQMVWFRGVPDLEWLPAPADLDAVIRKVEDFLGENDG